MKDNEYKLRCVNKLIEAFDIVSHCVYTNIGVDPEAQVAFNYLSDKRMTLINEKLKLERGLT